MFLHSATPGPNSLTLNTVTPETKIPDLSNSQLASDDLPADEAHDEAPAGLSEDDLAAAYADWCLDGRGFGADT